MPDDIQFDRTVDAVSELGMDPTGAEPIDDRLAAALQAGTRIEFPAGEYRITEQTRLADRTAIVGMGDSRADVRFVPPRGESFQWVNFNNSHSIRLRDFTIDRRADYETSVGMGGNIKRDFHLVNVEYDGWTPSGPQLFASNVTDPDGVAIVDGLYRTGPTQFQRYPESSLDIWSGRGHEGTLILRNVEIHNGSESGIYTGKGDGDYIIEDGYFKNVVHTAIRTAGKGSVIRGCTVVMDTEAWDSRNELVESTWGDGETPRPQLNRGIWCQTADREFTGPLIEDCDILVRNTEQGLAGVRVNSDTGGARLRDVRVRVDDGQVIPIYAKAPTDEAGAPLEMDLDGVHVCGEDWRAGALTFEERPRSVVANSHVAGGGNGIVGDGISVTQTTVDVEGASEYAGDGGGPPLEEPTEPGVRPSEHEKEPSTDPSMENVRDHGAAGDGQHDDTAAIRRAADAAGPGGTVYFPSGEYLVGASERIAIQYPGDGSWDDITWKGDGTDESLITMAGGQTKTHFVFLVKNDAQAPDSATFEGLSIDGNKDAQSNDSVGLCILCEGRGTFRMDQCHIHSAQNDNVKFNGRMDAEITNSQISRAGYVWNGGHGVSPNQEGQTTTVIRQCLFNDQMGADVDVGVGQDSGRYPPQQTVLIERCFARDNYRGFVKFSDSNKHTTIRNCITLGNSNTEIPIKANPGATDIGTVTLENCIIDGGKFPAIDLPRPGRLELDTVTIQNVGLGGHRGGAGIHSDRIEVDAERVSIHGTDSQVHFVESASGSLRELIHEGQPVGSDAGIVQSRRKGDPLAPEVPRESEVGPNGTTSPPAPDDGTTTPTAPAERPPTKTVRVTGLGKKTDYCIETDGEIYPGEDVESWDKIHQGAVDGWVTSTEDVDVFEFESEPTRVRFRQGRATVEYGGEDVTPPPGDYVELRASEGAESGTPYSFVVEGSVAKGPNANENDSITENGDGTVTVEGQGGSGGSDDYYVDGEIVDADWDATAWSLFRGETEVPLSELEATPPDETSPENGGNVGVQAHGIGFERRVDAVGDLGMDASGNEVCDDALASIDAGTLVEFPAGTYRIKSCWIRQTNVGLVAKDGADVTFQCAPTDVDYSLLLKTGGDHVLSGIDIDRSAGGDGVVVVAKEGDLHIGDMELRGVLEGGVDGLAVSVEDPDGTGTLERIEACDGSAYDSASHGIFVAKAHAGRLEVHDCEVCNWTDNGLYASSPGYIGSYKGTETTDRGDGEVHVRGGRYENNNISQIRIGSTNASVKGAHVGVHPSPAGLTWSSREYAVMPRSGTEPEPVVNARGIWLKNRTGLVVEDCDIVMETGRASAGIMVDSAVGEATVRNTRVHVSSGECLYSLDAHAPSMEWDTAGLTCEGLSVTGVGGSEGTAVRIRGRAHSTIRESCVQVSRGKGVTFDSAGGTVVDSSVSAPDGGVVGGTTENVSAGETCPVPAGVSEDWFEGVPDDPDETVHHVEVAGPTEDSSVEFMFRVSGAVLDYGQDEAGDIVPIPKSATRYDDGSVVVATMQASWTPEFFFTGEIVEAWWPAGATVEVDGEVIVGGSE